MSEQIEILARLMSIEMITEDDEYPDASYYGEHFFREEFGFSEEQIDAAVIS